MELLERAEVDAGRDRGALCDASDDILCDAVPVQRVPRLRPRPLLRSDVDDDDVDDVGDVVALPPVRLGRPERRLWYVDAGGTCRRRDLT